MVAAGNGASNSGTVMADLPDGQDVMELNQMGQLGPNSTTVGLAGIFDSPAMGWVMIALGAAALAELLFGRRARRLREREGGRSSRQVLWLLGVASALGIVTGVLLVLQEARVALIPVGGLVVAIVLANRVLDNASDDSKRKGGTTSDEV